MGLLLTSVVVTSGTKRWRLYSPLAGFELPNKPSKDLPQEIIGEPIMDVVLHVSVGVALPHLHTGAYGKCVHKSESWGSSDMYPAPGGRCSCLPISLSSMRVSHG